MTRYFQSETSFAMLTPKQALNNPGWKSARRADRISRHSTDCLRAWFGINPHPPDPIANRCKGAPEDSIASMIKAGKMTPDHPLAGIARARARLSQEEIFLQTHTSHQAVFEKIERTGVVRRLSFVDQTRYIGLRRRVDACAMKNHFAAFSTQLYERNDPGDKVFAHATFASYDLLQYLQWVEDPSKCQDQRFRTYAPSRSPNSPIQFKTRRLK